ncbi:MAG TPA: TIGR03435 family protein [Bryobacteraceae bacterium]
MPRSLTLALFTAAALSAVFAQHALEEPRFEVASIKPSDPNPEMPTLIGMSADGAMVKYTNITLRDCIRGAYLVRDFQIVGPDWMTKSRFTINAKLPAGASPDQIPEMLKALLSERFKLEMRRETKEQSVYALLVGNGGARLKPTEVKADNNSPKALGPDGKPRPMMSFMFPPGGAVTITAPSASIESLVGLMSRFTGKPVVDMTGIKGQYEFRLTFAAETEGPHTPAVDDAATPVEPAPSVLDAVKQYGLRLEARKAPIEMLIVTHFEKAPTED